MNIFYKIAVIFAVNNISRFLSSNRGKEGVSGGNGRRVTSPYASAVADYLGKSVLVCPFCSLS